MDVTDPTSASLCTPSACRVHVSSSSGGASPELFWTAMSSGTSCRWVLDTQVYGPAPCAGSVTVPASALDEGRHVLQLLVDEGPAGVAECRTAFEVLADTGCQVQIDPSEGDLQTLFTWSASSAGEACVWSMDGVFAGLVPECDMSSSFDGARVLGGGPHPRAARGVRSQWRRYLRPALLRRWPDYLCFRRDP